MISTDKPFASRRALALTAGAAAALLALGAATLARAEPADQPATGRADRGDSASGAGLAANRASGLDGT